MRSRTLPARVYHLAEAANWPSICLSGLLSTKVLLDLAGLQGTERERIERCQRLEHTTLPNGVQVRDQKPLPERSLATCLVGLTPPEWYELINSQVFFWLDADRLNRQRRACEPRPQVVLVVDARRLVARYAERVSLSRINSGQACRRPAMRGRCTFVPYRLWIETGWSSETEGLGIRLHARSQRPVELTVAEDARDVMSCLIDVRRLGSGEAFRP
ncbi:hypothetical protein DNFV4_00188 [Nitrospira tepida]|uniref:Uncharacterized protein n=1 Tax=Nitrospira tepida TaxID=2973512 RepID=A0AA86MVH5_9BACT|nr:hypothetical protein [Nitrospira tepida]CAI4029770.1 hypothetical protein DNFV4_00188 [Nitrospira tepida]